jgi:hypothetical protein
MAATRKTTTERTVAELERAGVRVERTNWGHAYIGTPGAMIAAGFLSPEQVPGDPACSAVKVFRFERAGRHHIASLFRHGTLIRLHVGPTHEEAEAERDQECGRRVAEDCAKEIAWLPRSREQYAQRVARAVSVRSAREFLLEPLGGYRVSEGAWNEFEQAVDMALDELLEQVTFSRAARDREIAAWRQKAADADPGFAQFMRAVVEGADG